ncbi:MULTISPECIES: hypothetical protein [unclassified Neochlamydia]|nr:MULTISPECIES: hypothetical protein [unclassified Neochlamydia]
MSLYSTDCKVFSQFIRSLEAWLYTNSLDNESRMSREASVRL